MLVNSIINFSKASKMDKFHYLYNTVPANYIKKILKEEKNSLLVFDPDSHWTNINTIYKSTEKIINSIYFGSARKIKNPYSHCKTNKEIFNLSRRILIE